MRWRFNRNKGFITALEKNPTSMVVDLGCGNCIFSNVVKEAIEPAQMIVVDSFIPEKKDLHGMEFVRANLEDILPFANNSFDVIISNQVIEHIKTPVKFMQEIFRILKPGGYAVISTENLASWDNIFALLFGYVPFSMEFDQGHFSLGKIFSAGYITQSSNDHPHLRIFSWKGIIALALTVGFTVEKQIGSGHIFGKLGEVLNKKKCRFITVKLRKN
jgi:ubiquinone/menaquinone biosynthesis C-methylase UbiE